MLFEYVMLAGVNDTDADAARLAALAADIEAKFNLITFNPHAGTRFAPSPPERARARTARRGPAGWGLAAGRSLAAGALHSPAVCELQHAWFLCSLSGCACMWVAQAHHHAHRSRRYVAPLLQEHLACSQPCARSKRANAPLF